MAKAVLISIRPEWCEKIARNEKTVEVRKTQPKMETPFKCYVYRTKGVVKHIAKGEWFDMPVGGTVIGEFTCDRITPLFNVCTDDWKYLAGDVHEWQKKLVKQASLSEAELRAYAKGQNCFAWHISGMKIYDKPKQLSKFTGLRKTKFGAEPIEIKRPPQSWCYVEELK